MDKKKKTIVWLVLFIFLITMFLTIATYAYFATQDYYSGTFNVELTSKGVDTLAFSSSEDVNISANVNNFSMDFGHDVTGEAIVRANLETTKASTEYCYEVSVKLPDEEVFTYSNGTTPELVLNILKSNDDAFYENIITDMDITTKTGLIKIPVSNNSLNYKHVISTTKNVPKSDYWKAQITLKWFENVDQTINDLKTYNATLKANIIDC